MLRQLVDGFVHDRARPEVMTLGLRAVRELCARAPLVMQPELLQVGLAACAQPGCPWSTQLHIIAGHATISAGGGVHLS